MTIFKYNVPMDDEPTIQMPRGARVLSVAVQHNCAYVWALVDPTAATVSRRFRVAGTGHPVSSEWASAAFVGTVLLMGGSLVFHVFDGGEMSTDGR